MKCRQPCIVDTDCSDDIKCYGTFCGDLRYCHLINDEIIGCHENEQCIDNICMNPTEGTNVDKPTEILYLDKMYFHKIINFVMVFICFINIVFALYNIQQCKTCCDQSRSPV